MMGEAKRMAEHMAGEQKRLRDGAPDISDWTIVLFGARSLFGLIERPDGSNPGFFCLNPAYEIQRSPQQVGHGKMALVHVSQPSVWVPINAAILIQLKDLNASEVKDWSAAVLQCDERTKAMRAADAGIQLAGPGALNGLPRPGH
jgi:hypothetical protein